MVPWCTSPSSAKPGNARRPLTPPPARGRDGRPGEGLGGGRTVRAPCLKCVPESFLLRSGTGTAWVLTDANSSRCRRDFCKHTTTLPRSPSRGPGLRQGTAPGSAGEPRPSATSYASSRRSRWGHDTHATLAERLRPAASRPTRPAPRGFSCPRGVDSRGALRTGTRKRPHPERTPPLSRSGLAALEARGQYHVPGGSSSPLTLCRFLNPPAGTTGVYRGS